MSNRKRLEYKKSLVLHKIETTDNVGQMLNKINLNFLEIQNNGGGPLGLEGKQGPPGCRGARGPAGKDGENAMDEWIAKIGKSCDGVNVFDIEDEIVNKKCDRNLLLTNLTQVGDIRQIKQTGSDFLTVPFVPADFKDYKLKIYTSANNGNGRHIHLMNSKAAISNKDYLCHSGYTIALDWNKNTNEEDLNILGQKNENIQNHTHIVNIESDLINLARNSTSQIMTLDAGPGNSDYKGTFKLETLTSDQLFHTPDRTGYVGIWQDTLDHSEIWETITIDNLNIRYARYYDGNSDIILEDNHWVYIDENSEIRFKRLNNFILIDWHIGIRREIAYDNFYVKNIQFKVDKATLGARTIGWELFSILQSEAFEDDTQYNDFGYYTITPTDSSDTTIADTFLISLQFHNDRILPFTSSGNKEKFWFKGQSWATVVQEDTSCLQLNIEQEDICPYLEIY